MALIDPCLALPLSASCSQLADEREAADRDDDQPLTPTTPTTPTTHTADMTASSQPVISPFSSSAAQAGSVSSSSSSSSAVAVASSSAASLTASSSGSVVSMTALPTVLQSVFSYIFTDHHQQQQHRDCGANAQQPQPQPSASQAGAGSSSAAAASTSSAAAFASSSSTFSPSHAGAASASAAGSPASPASAAISPAASHPPSSPVVPLSPCSSSSSPSSPSSSSAPPSVRHCAILDLDETLLHSFFPDKVTPYQYQYMVMRCKAQEDEERAGRLPPNQRSLYQVDVGDGTIVVLMLRPHLRPFLMSLFAHYDVGVWSAGGKLYVDAICRVLFPPESGFRPLFQLCWDDVQVETNGLSSYTKPLTTLIARYAQLQLHLLFLVDNRKENGLHFPAQLVIAPDYLPRPWEWNGDRDRDLYLMDDALHSIHDCVQNMKHREAELAVAGALTVTVHQPFSLSSRLAGDDLGVSLGGGSLLLDAADDSMREEEDEEEDGSEMGLDDADGEVDDVEGEDERCERPAEEEQDEADADDSSDMDDDDNQSAADLYMMDVQQQRRPAQRRQQQKSAA